MKDIDPLRVIFFGSVLLAGLMAIFHMAGWLFNQLPKLLAVVKSAGSSNIPIYTLIVSSLFHLFVLAPIIRYFVPKATMVETEAERPLPTNLALEHIDEHQAAEARRCRLPGPVCDLTRTQLESKTREVARLVKELGEAEERELDAKDAADANRNSHKLIRKRLDRAEQQLVRYDPEANTIRKLETLLAESEKRVLEAEQRVEEGERLLKAEVEHSKWALEKKETQTSKVKQDMAKLAGKAKDRIGVLNAKINSLERELDAAKRKDMPADVEVLLAEKDVTIQFLTEAGLATEKDRDEKMVYAETMYAALQMENDSIRQQLSDAAKRTSSDNDAVRSLRDDLANAHAQIKTAETVFVEKEKKIYELMNQLKKVEEESGVVKNQVGKLRVELLIAQEKMATGATNENIQALNRKLEDLRNQAADAQSSHDSKMSQASAIHTEQQQCIESLRNETKAVCIENTNMRHEISRLQELLNQHAASRATSSAKSSVMEQRIAAMKQQHQTDQDEAKSMLDAKDVEINHLQDSLAGMKTHVASLQEEVAEMQEYADGQDEEVEKAEKKLRKALANEKKAIERFTALVDKRKKEASADLLKYNRLKVEYNKATQERDNLLAGSQTDETKRLSDQLAMALDSMVTRDLQIAELKEQIGSVTSNTRNGHAGANTSTEKQNDPNTDHSQMQLYTPETERKQRKAFETIERARSAEGNRDDDAEVEDEAQSDDDAMETESAGGEEEREGDGTKDESFEAAMNAAIDQSDREYKQRTTVAFAPAIRAPGVTNPFAAPGPPATARDFSAMFAGPGPMATVGGAQTARQPAASPEKPATPESATERHLSGATFWVPRRMSATASSPQQQQQQKMPQDDGREAPDTPAPITGRRLKKPSGRRLRRAKGQGDL
ncbi:hypothetical protein LX32DRAFT_727732 [Colletotrichum zoysiae]|uniref:Uncharacterized protein n=1 Tax=Colletotrichum zoysiae TaxID=1216348 RepID=A0AAD9HIL0_9PEZI|nr:hypothetical protein LX32DRAFT_727732 [Colletotrichum zoysiae]